MSKNPKSQQVEVIHALVKQGKRIVQSLPKRPRRRRVKTMSGEKFARLISRLPSYARIKGLE